MLVHSVYIWIHDSVPQREKEAHLARLKALASIETVRQFHLGVPAGGDRPVIERGYTYALIAGFDDRNGLEQYRAHPLHQALQDEIAAYWAKQVVYDSIDIWES